MGKIDFKRVAEAARQSAHSLVPEWLPDGKREGAEWSAINPTRGDTKPGSFKVNLNTGAWSDFATDHKGGDLISLYAYVFGVDQLAAAKELAERLRLDNSPAQASQGYGAKKEKASWTPIHPAPLNAGDAPVAHVVRGRPESRWRYRTRDDQTIGWVYRFRTSDGGKETLPLCWARADDGREDWRWLSFAQPRPLYCELWPRDDVPALIVEGEKCVTAATELLGERFRVMSWPGGCKAVSKADWSQVTERKVFIWPDADEPGLKAAREIAQILHARGVEVWGLRSAALVDRPQGWDVADAVAEGWGTEALTDFIQQNSVRFDPDALTAKSISTPQGAGAGDSSWMRDLISAKVGWKDCRENVIFVLRDHPAWKGVLAVDEFARRIVVRKPSPLGHSVGQEWTPNDDVALGIWTAQAEQLNMVVRSKETISDAVRHVAKMASYHPVREWLDSLEWDQQARIDQWAPQFLGAPDTEYHRLVGRFFLINLVRRIYEPGCVMRSVPVLEGKQNRGKSMALRTLAQPWFSDTMFRVGDKDAYQQIQGVWLYEISELESFTRSEATAVKAFISSTEDNFRAPYERVNEKHKRQTMFGATTNATEYLKDWTGNTRFWPLPIGERVDLDGLAAAREQLLAEALALYRMGERTYPTMEQEEQLFRPEQEARVTQHAWVGFIAEYCATRTSNEVTLTEILRDCLKIEVSRMNLQGADAQKVAQILLLLGYEKIRGRIGEIRETRYRKPVAQREPVKAAGDEKPEADYDVPF